MKTRAWLRLLQFPWLNVTKCTFYSWILSCSEKQNGRYADFFSFNNSKDTSTNYFYYSMPLYYYKKKKRKKEEAYEKEKSNDFILSIYFTYPSEFMLVTTKE